MMRSSVSRFAQNGPRFVPPGWRYDGNSNPLIPSRISASPIRHVGGDALNAGYVFPVATRRGPLSSGQIAAS